PDVSRTLKERSDGGESATYPTAKPQFSTTRFYDIAINVVEAFLKSNISQKKFQPANLNWSVNSLFSPEFQPN
ncbi:MAG: hypothetical protein ACPGOX_06085, partial [Flavobacteriales bacterium]